MYHEKPIFGSPTSRRSLELIFCRFEVHMSTITSQSNSPKLPVEIELWTELWFGWISNLNQSSTAWPLNETEEALGNRNTFRRDQVVESLRSFGTAWPPPGCVRSPILKRFGALEACERWCRIATLTSSKMKSGAANHSEWDHMESETSHTSDSVMRFQNPISHEVLISMGYSRNGNDFMNHPESPFLEAWNKLTKA